MNKSVTTKRDFEAPVCLAPYSHINIYFQELCFHPMIKCSHLMTYKKSYFLRVRQNKQFHWPHVALCLPFFLLLYRLQILNRMKAEMLELRVDMRRRGFRNSQNVSLMLTRLLNFTLRLMRERKEAATDTHIHARAHGHTTRSH